MRGVGDFLVVQPFDVGQNERDSLIGRQLLDGGLDDAGQPYQRYIQTSLALQKPVALVFGPESDTQAAMDLVDLLAEASMNLVLVPMSQVTTTNWSQYAAVLVDSATSSNADWGSAAQRSALQASGLPILGLGQGGYALFNDLGLDLGGVSIITGTITTTLPVTPSFSAWTSPFPLAGSSPYQLYNDSDGLAIDLPVGSPPAGVQLIGLAPASGFTNIGLEDLHFMLWSFNAGPTQMTSDGQRLFLNLLLYLLQQ